MLVYSLPFLIDNKEPRSKTASLLISTILDCKKADEI